MKNFVLLALGTAAFIGLAAPGAQAAERYQDRTANFTSHHEVPMEDYAPQARKLPADEKLALREYLNYEQREPCQNYQNPPQSFVDDGCGLETPKPAPQKMAMQQATVTQTTTTLRPVVTDYDILFDFDKSNIRADERSTIDQVVQDIKRYNPYEVTLQAWADRSGPADYNMQLSQRRAQAVSEALTQAGIPNRILDEEANGEHNLPVPTQDGVRLQENRRVEIQFRK